MPDVKNYLDKAGVADLWEKIKAKFVVKEFKTGSQSEYKVLSDNNLTDALKQKILDAGDSSFDGQYTSLTGKPQIEGHELASGNNTAASLGLATSADLTNATNDMATQTWVESKDYATSGELTTAVTDMATKTWVGGQGFAKASEVTSQITTATADMATKTWVEGKGYATTSNVNTLISQAVSTVYTPKGSVASLDELNVKDDAGKVGDVWNITNAFTTDLGFIEGPGKGYPAGTNVVLVEVSGLKKWDVLAGSVDLSGYLEAADLVAITETELDDICV